MKTIILVLAAISTANGIFNFGQTWNALRVSWYANPISTWGFDGLPRTLKENNGEFELKDDQCQNGNGRFVGQRYWYKNDPAMILLFDKNGIIAGIQTSVPKNLFTPDPLATNKYYIDDGEYWTLTAYFVDPSTICSQGRTTDDLTKQGTGTGLWLQFGTNAIADSVSIPVQEADVKKTKWGFGKCFWTMGQHYWYNVSKTMNCGDLVPNCLLYNKGKLTGFCFAHSGFFPSSRYDSPAPTPQVVNKFLNPVPDCMFNDPDYQKQSTLHVYFNEHPRATSWC